MLSTVKSHGGIFGSAAPLTVISMRRTGCCGAGNVGLYCGIHRQGNNAQRHLFMRILSSKGCILARNKESNATGKGASTVSLGSLCLVV
mmetsp:Transcript_43835/g.51333  ORF Transcript_43835/g.51333 Transcript_43835/m.51333 type:complete len:89 (-) Transcript_43835:718-984(-)